MYKITCRGRWRNDRQRSVYGGLLIVKFFIEMQGITKRFPGVLANDNVDFSVVPGEIHALLGENGSGKSTLMSILSGMYRPDGGKIQVRGREVTLKSPGML